MRTSLFRFTVVVAAWLALAAPSLAQDGTQEHEGTAPVDFRVEPAPDAATSPRGGWFVLDLEPGSQTRQGLTVHNRSDEPIELTLAAVDADTGPTGGASYRRLEAPVESTGGWVALERQRIRLGPGEADTIVFTVSVPDDAESGDHLAGIAVWADDDVEEVDDASGAVVAIEQRRVVAVHVILPGPAEPLLRIGGVEPQAHSGGVRLRVNIANEGHGLTSGQGVIEVVEPAFERTFEFGTFVPRTAIDYPVAWVEERPAEGTYQARVRLEYGDSVETWEGTFTIGEAISRELDEYEAERDGGAVDPWWWLATAIGAATLVLAIMGWVLYRLGRRRQTPAPLPAHARPADPPPPSPPSAMRDSRNPPVDGQMLPPQPGQYPTIPPDADPQKTPEPAASPPRRARRSDRQQPNTKFFTARGTQPESARRRRRSR